MIWRGWAGAVCLLLIVLGGAIGGGIAGSTHSALGGVLVGGGIVAGGAAAYAVGRYANVIAPQAKLEGYTAQRHAELHNLVEQGRFSLGPGHEMPRSVQEAHQQADGLLAAERDQLGAALRKHHHVWFIPAQFVGLIGMGLGVVIAVAYVVTTGGR